MKLIGLLIGISILGLFAVWWISKSFQRTESTMQVIQEVEQSAGGESIQGQNPVDYSKQKSDEFEKLQKERAEDVNQIP